MRSLINAAVFIERVVVLTKRDSNGVGVRHVSRLRMQFALQFFPVLPHMHVAKEISHGLFRETRVMHLKSLLGRLWLRSMFGLSFTRVLVDTCVSQADVVLSDILTRADLHAKYSSFVPSSSETSDRILTRSLMTLCQFACPLSVAECPPHERAGARTIQRRTAKNERLLTSPRGGV